MIEIMQKRLAEAVKRQRQYRQIRFSQTVMVMCEHNIQIIEQWLALAEYRLWCKDHAVHCQSNMKWYHRFGN